MLTVLGEVDDTPEGTIKRRIFASLEVSHFLTPAHMLVCVKFISQREKM
jgi:hypothetical protein